MEIKVSHRIAPPVSYRVDRVRSLFNVGDGREARFDLAIDAPDLNPDGDWQIGVVVGPSGSGKSSIGGVFWPEDAEVYDFNAPWPEEAIVDAIAPGAGGFDAVTGALASAGLGDVPAWLRPYSVLSTGQRFRADLARTLALAPDRVVLDEFTSVVDRQIARVGAASFAKSWRRSGGRALILTCHYDVLDWLEPDWVIDTATGKYSVQDNSREGKRWERPRIDVEIRLGGWELWQLFKPHHYLDVGPAPFGKAYVGFVDGEPVAHIGMASRNVGVVHPETGKRMQAVEARGCRMVVLPEWQGIGVGTRMLNEICRRNLAGEGHLRGRKVTTVFNTSHPQLAQALRRSPLWRQISGGLPTANRGDSAKSIQRTRKGGGNGIGYGGHLRSVQGFRYYGEG